MITHITIRPLRYPPSAQPKSSGSDVRQLAATQEADGADRKQAGNWARSENLSTDELRLVEQLKHRDQEVRAHELAHKTIAGAYARGAPSYTYQVGPDGKRYAVGGEVGVDISKEADPQQTLQKARLIRRAAMAPANPSAQDRQIALRAAAMAAEAQQEILRLQAESETTAVAGATAATRDGQDRTAAAASQHRAINSFSDVMYGSLASPRQGYVDQLI